MSVGCNVYGFKIGINYCAVFWFWWLFYVFLFGIDDLGLTAVSSLWIISAYFRSDKNYSIRYIFTTALYHDVSWMIIFCMYPNVTWLCGKGKFVVFRIISSRAYSKPVNYILSTKRLFLFFLFNVLSFWSQSMWDLGSPTKDRAHTLPQWKAKS